MTATPIAIIGAIVALSLLAVAAIIGLLVVGPKGESTPLIAVILGFLSPTILALLGLLKLEQLHVSINSRVDQLLDSTQTGAFARGQATTGTDPVLPGEQSLPLPPKKAGA